MMTLMIMILMMIVTMITMIMIMIRTIVVKGPYSVGGLHFGGILVLKPFKVSPLYDYSLF